jgi:ABC-type Na+ efflux pump permease subunit
MWNFLMALFVGSAVGSTRTAQRLVRPMLILFLICVLVAGLIYACVVFRAVSERSRAPHVTSSNTH